jgi:DNA-damage-inducible protein D
MSNIKLFQSKEIRSICDEESQQWYFVVTDVIQVLTDSLNPSDYLKKMRKRDEQLSQG